MFTKNAETPELTQARAENAHLRERNKTLGEKNEKLTLALQRLLKFHGVRENYTAYRNEYPCTQPIPYINLDQLAADLEAVYAVTKADEARARLTSTEKEPKGQSEQTREEQA